MNFISIEEIASDEDDKSLEDGDCETLVNNTYTTHEGESQSQEDLECVWFSRGKPTERDNTATQILLDVRGSEEYMKKFDNKRNIKVQLWKEIANIMNDAGFDVNAEKCQQKFLNLSKTYINFKRHVHQTGNDRKSPPEFYDDPDHILGKKDKVILANIADTIDFEKGESSKNTSLRPDTPESVGYDENASIKNTLKNGSNKTSVTKKDILETITECNERQMKTQCKQFDKMFNLLQDQNKIPNEQRKRLIDIFGDTLKKDKKKRRRSSSSD